MTRGIHANKSLQGSHNEMLEKHHWFLLFNLCFAPSYLNNKFILLLFIIKCCYLLQLFPGPPFDRRHFVEDQAKVRSVPTPSTSIRRNGTGNKLEL